MEKEVITIQTITNDESVNVDYSDDDIIIFDTIRKFADPSVARVNMNLLAVCFNGRVQAQMNGQALELGKNQVIICPPNVVISDFMFSPDFEFKAMFLTNRILQSFLREKIGIWNDMMYVYHTHLWTMNEADVEYFKHFYEMLRIGFAEDNQNPYRIEITQSLLRSAFLGLCGRFKQQIPGVDNLPSGARAPSNLFQRFLELINNSKVKYRTVGSYASDLCISPKYLSTVCKKQSGRTANEWITEHVLEDIRYYLKQTDYSVKQICDLMGFPNPSFFGRYVREHFGMTPVTFRNS